VSRDTLVVRVLSVLRRLANGIAGVILVALGSVAVLRAGGLGFDRHVDSIGFHHTALLGWVELFVGLMLVFAAIARGSGGETAFLGLLALGFGALVLATGDALHDVLGVHRENGILFIRLGAVVALLGFATLGREPPTPKR
jgi:hypothetical protein